MTDATKDRMLAALENISDLPKGRSDEDGPEHPSRLVIHSPGGRPLHVRRTPRGTWLLRLAPGSTHARWCDTKRHLLEDLGHFFMTNDLPQARQQW